MRKLFTVLSFIILCVANSYGEINYIQGEYVNSTTVRLWFNMDTYLGQNGYAQCRYNSGSSFTGFAMGAYDNTTVGGANWKIEINFGTSIPAVFDIEGAIIERPEYTGFAWTESLSNLPVELASFTANKESNSIALNWTTLSEENNAGFEIEKSVNGKDFEVIGTVEGAGNSIEQIDYKFIDKNPSQGVNYYRLKQTDFDGTYEYSDVVAIEFDAKIEASIFPNPAAEQLTISTAIQDMVNIRIVNIYGQVVFQKTQYIDNQLDLNIADLPVGNYFLQITNDSNQLILYNDAFVKK